MPRVQNISAFKLPLGFRGKSGYFVILWWLVQGVFFRFSPHFFYSWRSSILRLFGAKVGEGCLIRASAKFTYPWKVVIGNNVWIGDDVTLYSLDEIRIGDNTVISQKSYICAADHDYHEVEFPIVGKSVSIGNEVWIATDVFISPGVTIGNGVVVGARSSVFKDLPENMLCMGSPCKPIRPRN